MNKKAKETLELAWYVFLGFIIAVTVNRGMAYGLGTQYPVVAVVSMSMEHDNPATYEDWFLQRNFTEEELENRPFSNGMRKGDIVMVKGTPYDEIEVGDVIVYQLGRGKPIIHRVVKRAEEGLTRRETTTRTWTRKACLRSRSRQGTYMEGQ